MGDMRGVEYLLSPVGWLRLEAEGEAVVAVRFADNGGEGMGNCAVLQQAVEEWQAYFAGRLKTFRVPTRLQGTPFQERIRAALTEIPYGATWTYGRLATHIGCPRAVRAVGNACHRNPIPILVPCHRVLGKGDALTGYAAGIERKAQLLALERNVLLER